MGDKKLYTFVTKDDVRGPSARVEPSEYFLKLPPQEAIIALEAHIKSLEDRLAEFAKVDLKIPENLNKAREVSFELETVQDFLRCFKKDHETSN
jgi:hypothetical protein